jgi:hypothetical protein
MDEITYTNPHTNEHGNCYSIRYTDYTPHRSRYRDTNTNCYY